MGWWVGGLVGWFVGGLVCWWVGVLVGLGHPFGQQQQRIIRHASVGFNGFMAQYYPLTEP